MTNLKDTLTTIVAIGLVLFGAIDTFLKASAGTDINWLQLVLVIAGAIVAYFTGKKANGTTKSDAAVEANNSK